MVFKPAVLAGVVVAAQVFSSGAQAAESGKSAGDVVVRLRGISVVPDERSTVSAIGGQVNASNSFVPEVDFSYFFSSNLAVELIAAVTKHKATDEGSSAGNVPLGSAWLLPPTLTVQYHLFPAEPLSPYFGVGLNYTTMFSVKKPSTGPVTAIDYGDSVGPALQAGLDYDLGNRWSLNFDLKKVWIKSDVAINSGAINATVKLDPWIFGAGVGYRF